MTGISPTCGRVPFLSSALLDDLYACLIGCYMGGMASGLGVGGRVEEWVIQRIQPPVLLVNQGLQVHSNPFHNRPPLTSDSKAHSPVHCPTIFLVVLPGWFLLLQPAGLIRVCVQCFASFCAPSTRACGRMCVGVRPLLGASSARTPNAHTTGMQLTKWLPQSMQCTTACAPVPSSACFSFRTRRRETGVRDPQGQRGKPVCIQAGRRTVPMEPLAD